MPEAVFLDSNIFMYAAGAPHLYKIPCVQILLGVERGTLRAAINTEVFQEILYRYNRLKLADKGLALSREILRYPLVILPITEADIRLAVDVFDVHRSAGLKPRDAIHFATMQNNGLTQLISADKEFDVIPNIKRVDPLTY